MGEDQLNWTYINVPYGKVKEFNDLIEKNGREYYKGNSGQLKMAQELGEMHLGHLYSQASGLNLVGEDQLNWTYINVPYGKVKEFNDLIEKNGREYYKGNSGQLKMAQELGEMHLGHLYSQASGLNLVGEDQLNWTYINVPYGKVKEFNDLIEKNGEKYYRGIQGQTRMARDLGGYKLTVMYALASAFDLAADLYWISRDESCEEAEARYL